MSWYSDAMLPKEYAKGWQTYSANVMTIIADAVGLSIKKFMNAQAKQGSGPQNLWRLPNPSIRKAYSAPDRGTTELSSANVKDSATDIERTVQVALPDSRFVDSLAI
jgi:hypothetical protein